MTDNFSIDAEEIGVVDPEEAPVEAAIEGLEVKPVLFHEDAWAKVIHGDCLLAMREMPDNSVDAIVTDPPYGLTKIDETKTRQALTEWLTGDDSKVPSGKGFMNHAWDNFVPPPAVWREAMRVLKPGGYMLCFAGSRTIDLMTLSVRLGGFEIRDTIEWIYGSGFPKSLNISKAIDAKLGAERKVVGTRVTNVGMQGGNFSNKSAQGSVDITESATDEAKKWEGWGTALKPAHEPVIVAQKPLEGTFAENVLAYGTGGLNIDGARVPGAADLEDGDKALGRFPTNVVLSHLAECEDDTCADGCQVAEMDEQSGKRAAGNHPANRQGFGDVYTDGTERSGTSGERRSTDSGGASRYFPAFKYQAKAKKEERPKYVNSDGELVAHSTVKPLPLIMWMLELVVPRGGVVLDMFLGSGTTSEAATLSGLKSIGIENHKPHLPLIKERLEGRDLWAGSLLD